MHMFLSRSDLPVETSPLNFAPPADDANLSCLVDVARHDAHLALPRLDDARAVGT